MTGTNITLIYSAKTVKENINGGAPKNATGCNNAPNYSHTYAYSRKPAIFISISPTTGQ